MEHNLLSSKVLKETAPNIAHFATTLALLNVREGLMPVSLYRSFISSYCCMNMSRRQCMLRVMEILASKDDCLNLNLIHMHIW